MNRFEGMDLFLKPEQRKKEMCIFVTSYFVEHAETNEGFIKLLHNEPGSVVLTTMPSVASSASSPAK